MRRKARRLVVSSRKRKIGLNRNTYFKGLEKRGREDSIPFSEEEYWTPFLGCGSCLNNFPLANQLNKPWGLCASRIKILQNSSSATASLVVVWILRLQITEDSWEIFIKRIFNYTIQYFLSRSILITFWELLSVSRFSVFIPLLFLTNESSHVVKQDLKTNSDTRPLGFWVSRNIYLIYFLLI